MQFLDADDLLDPDKIRLCLEAFAPDTGLVFSGFRFFKGREETSGRAFFRNSLSNLFRISEPRWDPAQPLASVLRMGLGTPLPLHRKECLEKVGGFSEDLKTLEDVEMLARLLIAGVKAKKIDTSLVMVRDHASPGRLRLVSQRNLFALKTVCRIINHADRAGALNPAVKSALADMLANYGRKSYQQGYRDEAREAFRRALELNSFPKPTGVPLYNCLSRLLGLENTEKLFSCLRINK